MDKTTYAVSTTGIAGPGGGSPEKPVGLVWFGVTGPHGTVAHKANLIGNRDDIRQSAAELALYYVYTYITEKGEIKIMAVDGRQAALDKRVKTN